MKRVELLIEQIILASRWLLVVFYLGLTLALAIYALTFGKKLLAFFQKSLALDEADAILSMLSLIDAALVASLVVMVIIAGYENFVSRFEDNAEVHWLGTIDAGSLKIKVASTIVAISSIDLLSIFLDLTKYTESQIMWATIMHLAFVFSALILAYVDKMTSHGKSE
jgi:uncharacterized protein (TIGR00645 family)